MLRADAKPTLTSRILLDAITAALLCAATALPFLIVLATGTQIYETGYEFIAYRIGDALSLHFNEPQNVHPVQGLPSALVSKILTKLLYSVYRADIATRPVLQIYSLLFFSVGFAFLFGLVTTFWNRLTWPERGGVAFMVLTPWYIRFPGFHYLFAPEYWFAEYTFLAASAVLLPIIARSTKNLAPAIGAWVAIGAATKITLLGTAPIFFLALPHRSWRKAMASAAAFFLSYAAIVWAYAGFNFGIAVDIVAFQFQFFSNPNASKTYDDFRHALLSEPSVLILAAGAAIVTIAAARRRPAEALFSLLWIAIYAYVLWKRPHHSSFGSAGLSLIFICSRFMPQFPPMAGAAIVAIALLMPVNYNAFLAKHRKFVPNVPAWFKPTGVIFIPDNYWNAGLPLQTFGYNGQLGSYPVTRDERPPRYVTGGAAFRALFGDIVIGSHPEHVVSALRSGRPVFWSRPGEGHQREFVAGTRANVARLKQQLSDASAEIFEERVVHLGEDWYFGVARLRAVGTSSSPKRTDSRPTSSQRNCPGSSPRRRRRSRH